MVKEFDISYFSDLELMYSKFCKYILDKEKILSGDIKFLIYVENDEIVGFLEYSNYYERSEINNIYVLSNKRRCGIADKLINYYINSLLEDNIVNSTLEVNENNIAAINLYKKHGYKNVAVRKKYYDDADGILMLKELVVKE